MAYTTLKHVVAAITVLASAVCPTLSHPAPTLHATHKWANLTVFHVNPATYGATPINMDTADLLGDMYFDMRGAVVPIECQHPSKSPTASMCVSECVSLQRRDHDDGTGLRPSLV